MSRRPISLNILIADDQEDVRLGIRALLEKRREWRVCGEASTGAEAIEMARSLCPDMLLLDLTLPDMAAARVIPGVMAVCPTVKIVALAMPGSGDLAVKALIAGARGLAMKSDAAKFLLPTVENIANNQPWFSYAAWNCIKKRVRKEIRKEIKKLIQDRMDIDTTIAELRRLEARSQARVEKSEPIAREKSKNLVEIARKPCRRTRSSD